MFNLIYLILFGSFAIFYSVIQAIKILLPEEKVKLIVERILIYVLIAIFVVRFMCYYDIQYDVSYASFGGPMNPFLNTIGNLCLWLETTAALMIFLRPWSHFKTAKFYVKCIALPILAVSAIALNPMIQMMQGTTEFSTLAVMLPIEIGGLLSIGLYYLEKDREIKISKHSYAEAAVFSVLINFATMPCFMPAFFFGYGLHGRYVIDFSLVHRIYLYASCIVIPLAIYFSLRNAHQDKIHYTLVFISLGTMLSFMVTRKWDTLLAPWEWPLHLCNLAMILVPICLIFRLKKLFNFTYFINVFGATLAMLMPNYTETLLAFNPELVCFCINHCCAFMMPLLGVALYEF